MPKSAYAVSQSIGYRGCVARVTSLWRGLKRAWQWTQLALPMYLLPSYFLERPSYDRVKPRSQPIAPPPAERGSESLQWFSKEGRKGGNREIAKLRSACYNVLAWDGSYMADQLRAMEALEVLDGIQALREMGIYK